MYKTTNAHPYLKEGLEVTEKILFDKSKLWFKDPDEEVDGRFAGNYLEHPDWFEKVVEERDEDTTARIEWIEIDKLLERIKQLEITVSILQANQNQAYQVKPVSYPIQTGTC